MVKDHLDLNLQGAPLTLDLEAQKDLSRFINQCVLIEKNLKSTDKAFNSCKDTVKRTNGWWQTPTGAVSLGLGGVILGILIGGLAN